MNKPTATSHTAIGGNKNIDRKVFGFIVDPDQHGVLIDPTDTTKYCVRARFTFSAQADSVAAVLHSHERLIQLLQRLADALDGHSIACSECKEDEWLGPSEETRDKQLVSEVRAFLGGIKP